MTCIAGVHQQASLLSAPILPVHQILCTQCGGICCSMLHDVQQACNPALGRKAMCIISGDANGIKESGFAFSTSATVHPLLPRSFSRAQSSEGCDWAQKVCMPPTTAHFFVCVRRSTKSRLGGLNRRCLPRSSLSVGVTVSVTRRSNELNIKWVLAAGRGVLGCFAQRSSLMLRLARVSDARATAQQSVLEHKWPAKLPMASAFCGSRQRASVDNLSQYPIAAPQGTPFPTLR